MPNHRLQRKYDEEATDLHPDFVNPAPQGDEYDTVDGEVLPDLPTVVDLKDTVKLDEEDDEHDDNLDTVDLDQIPTSDEIQAVDDIPDVELADMAGSVPDAQSIEAEVDDEPLDVGELTDAEDDGAEVLDDVGVLEEQPGPGDGEIRLLRGEDTFTSR